MLSTECAHSLFRAIIVDDVCGNQFVEKYSTAQKKVNISHTGQNFIRFSIIRAKNVLCLASFNVKFYQSPKTSEKSDINYSMKIQ